METTTDIFFLTSTLKLFLKIRVKILMYILEFLYILTRVLAASMVSFGSQYGCISWLFMQLIFPQKMQATTIVQKAQVLTQLQTPPTPPPEFSSIST